MRTLSTMRPMASSDGCWPDSMKACLSRAGPASTHSGASGGRGYRLGELAVSSVQRLFGQPAEEGCLTTLYAATAPELDGGEYVAPAGPGHRRGTPAVAPPPRRALDPDTARRLWETSAQLTGVGFTALVPGAMLP